PRRDAPLRPWPADDGRVDAAGSARPRRALRRAGQAAARALRRTRRRRRGVPAALGAAARGGGAGRRRQRAGAPLPERSEPAALVPRALTRWVTRWRGRGCVSAARGGTTRAG